MADRRFPLHWPSHIARTPAQKRRDSTFKVNAVQSYDDLLAEANRFGASEIVVSMNAPRSAKTGRPYADAMDDMMDDPGVALWITVKDRPLVFACDAFRSARENMRAIFSTLDSLRRIERNGCHQMLAAAMSGFTALPSPSRRWHEVLGLPPTAKPAEITEARKRLAREHHTDGDRMQEINVAHDEGMKERENDA
jgi:hypothetical protein